MWALLKSLTDRLGRTGVKDVKVPVYGLYYKKLGESSIMDRRTMLITFPSLDKTE